MAYTTSEARQELLDSVAQAANELGFASACLAEAYEQLDEHSRDRIEAECFRPVQRAYGRAKRSHTEFAGRHRLQAAAFEQQPTGLASQGRPASSPARSRPWARPIARSLGFRTPCCRWKRATRSSAPGSRRHETRWEDCPGRPATFSAASDAKRLPPA